MRAPLANVGGCFMRPDDAGDVDREGVKGGGGGVGGGGGPPTERGSTCGRPQPFATPVTKPRAAAVARYGPGSNPAPRSSAASSAAE